ncbi:hypothetical protein T05_15183, partial [Trichinella murrelli]
MLLTAILVVIILALIYHFVTEKKQISEWKETRVQPMTEIPEKKTPEEIIKESKELQLKADKKQVGKTKKKTKSKKSKKAYKSIPKGTDISKEKTETDKKIEMTEIADKAASSQMPEADITSPKITLASEDTEIDVDQPNRVPPISEETVEKPVIKDEPNVEKKDFKKSKKRSRKRTKSKKSKKIVKDAVVEKAASSQMPKTDIISPKLTLANEATAIDFDQLHMVPPIADENVGKTVIKDEPKGEKKHSKKIKKKSKKRSKSKK